MKSLLVATALASSLNWTSQAQANESPESGTLILENANVVDVSNGTVLNGRSVIIKDGKIQSILSAADKAIPGKRVNLQGQYVVPGFNDMHAHPLNWEKPAKFHSQMLSYGVTGYRQMSGSDALLKTRKDGGNLTPGDSPDLLALSGEILSGMNTRSVEEGKKLIENQKALGADFIKVVDMAPDVYVGVIKEASRQGLPASGHMPMAVPTEVASASGLKSFEHFGAGAAEMLDCSSQEDNIRQKMAAQAKANADAPVQDDHGHQAAAAGDSQGMMPMLLANPMAFLPKEGFQVFQIINSTFDEKRCSELGKLLSKNKTWHVPTLIRLRTMMLNTAPEYTKNPLLSLMDEANVKLWKKVSEKHDGIYSAQDKQTLKEIYSRYETMTRLFDKQGVPMATGSDFGGSWLLAGSSLHEEFDLLEHAGLSPLKVLQMTSINSAQMLTHSPRLP
ncbi:MAG: hypothetical protein EOP04_15095, partial [Proteobacteria bacterium]